MSKKLNFCSLYFLYLIKNCSFLNNRFLLLYVNNNILFLVKILSHDYITKALYLHLLQSGCRGIKHYTSSLLQSGCGGITHYASTLLQSGSGGIKHYTLTLLQLGCGGIKHYTPTFLQSGFGSIYNKFI